MENVNFKLKEETMKKLLLISVFTLIGLLSFAAPAAANGGNGNGGKDKIGGYIGWPTGLSYSHEFNDLAELDLLFAYSGFFYQRLQLQLGALFTVFDPVLPSLGNQKCPLSLGPVLGTSLTFALGHLRLVSLNLLLPLRWEMNFADTPDFNLFFDFAPLGMALNFYKEYNSENDTYKIKVSPRYDFRLGIGLRYRIPNKK